MESEADVGKPRERSCSMSIPKPSHSVNLKTSCHDDHVLGSNLKVPTMFGYFNRNPATGGRKMYGSTCSSIHSSAASTCEEVHGNSGDSEHTQKLSNENNSNVSELGTSPKSGRMSYYGVKSAGLFDWLKGQAQTLVIGENSIVAGDKSKMSPNSVTDSGNGKDGGFRGKSLLFKREMNLHSPVSF